jgi:diketogulonate reductase-like aldo/keto reductase
MAHSPLERSEKLTDETLVGLAEKHSKTAAQVLIRYSLQKGFVPLPKSENEARIEENAQVFDFELSEQDMTDMDSLGVINR